MLAKRAASGCPIWGALTLNEYCQPGDPLWTALWSKLSSRIDSNVPKALIEMLASGARAAEIDLDWKMWCASNAAANSQKQTLHHEGRKPIIPNSGFRRIPARDRIRVAKRMSFANSKQKARSI